MTTIAVAVSITRSLKHCMCPNSEYTTHSSPSTGKLAFWGRNRVLGSSCSLLFQWLLMTICCLAQVQCHLAHTAHLSRTLAVGPCPSSNRLGGGLPVRSCCKEKTCTASPWAVRPVSNTCKGHTDTKYLFYEIPDIRNVNVPNTMNSLAEPRKNITSQFPQYWLFFHLIVPIFMAWKDRTKCKTGQDE